jgi:hypothetical protein
LQKPACHLQPAKNPDIKDVILSVSEESPVFLFKPKDEIL